MALLERKRQQWAQERAEMEAMRWGPLPPSGAALPPSRARFASSLEIRSTCPPSSQQDLLPRRQRSPSLPPLPRCAPLSYYHLKGAYDEAEGDTSGYASEAPAPPVTWECQCENDSVRERKGEGERRPRWGEKGVAVGGLWEPQDPDQRLSQSTPSWLERGLTETQNIFAETTTSSLDGYMEPKASTLSERFTYLLGQNIPIESSVKAERESKRLKALQLQAAIVQQLEERAQKKKAEKEKLMREEREEEERFKKQKELELQRLQQEKRISEEKQQREQRRSEALRLALEKAEQQAKEEKESKKMKKLRGEFDTMSITSEPTPASPKKSSLSSASCNESKLIQNIYIEQAFSPRKKILSESDTSQNLASDTNLIMSSPRSARFSRGYENNNCSQIDNMKPSEQSSIQNIAIPLLNSTNSYEAHNISLVPVSLSQELFTPMSFPHPGVQMAFLMPQQIYQCVHPVSVQPMYQAEGHRTVAHYGNTNTDSEDTSSNRVLTPSKYRNPNSRDVSTQTDFSVIGEASPKKSLEYPTSIEAVTPLEILEDNTEVQSSDEKGHFVLNKKESKVSPGDKYKDIESRPKWGANKPPTQYKKQSEKDIFYSQKRKLRTKKRIPEKQYTSHSSDENTSPSPQENKTFNKLCRNQFSVCEKYWQVDKVNNKLGFGSANNISVETTEISPLKYCDKSGLVRVCGDSGKENKLVRETTADTKRISLSQKFMNDKYGNPKLWSASTQSEERKLPQKGKDKTSQRQSIIEVLSKTKKDQMKYQCDTELSRPVLLNQIKTLKDSLKKQQQVWGRVKSPLAKGESEFEME